MRMFRTSEPDPVLTDDAASTAEPIAGDRGIPEVNRAPSVQSRLSSFLALGLMCALGVGFLTWYYARTLARPAEVHQAAQTAAKSRAQGEMTLPSLGRIEAPRIARADPPAPPTEVPVFEQAIGSAPPPPAVQVLPTAMPMPVGAAAPPPQKTPGELAMERRLAGPAFARGATDATGGGAGNGSAIPSGSGSTASDSADPLQALLKPTLTPAVSPSVLPTQRFLLAKGAFIDCTLETAIDSTLPGMTTCITATDTFSADGSVVLLERGTKLVGETRGQVAQGTSRIFVLWSEARTPTGVIVPLSSPGTDELGRSGLAGEVNRHFWDRFGAAILLTVINGAVQGLVNSQNNAGSVVITPSGTTDVMTEILRSTVSIPPTVTKAQGDRIQVFVARDVDFRSVYALRVANAAAAVPAGVTP
jgi:type IV secretion system protein VirB10